MTLDSPKSLPGLLALPRSLSSIAVSLGGLAVFLVFASSLLVSFPNLHGYFYGVDNSNKLVPVDYSTTEKPVDSNVDLLTRNSKSGSSLEEPVASSSVNESVHAIDNYAMPSKSRLPATSSVVSRSEDVNQMGDLKTVGNEGKGLDENIPVASSPEPESRVNPVLSAVSNATTIGSDDKGKLFLEIYIRKFID